MRCRTIVSSGLLWITAWLGLHGLTGETFAAEVAVPQSVAESTRQVPLAYDVDVVVVGGGTGAVAAAVEAAKAGAKVFLAAPYPYLGDDMTATLRLWLEDGETPTSDLAKRIFSDRGASAVRRDLAAFSYLADIDSAPQHRDTKVLSRLTDGKFGEPATDSVQFNGDVVVTCKLEKPTELVQLRLLGYHRKAATTGGGGGFSIADVEVESSDDGVQWHPIGRMKRESRPEDELMVFSLDLKARPSQVRFKVAKPAQYSRILLGEIELVRSVEPLPQQKRPAPRPMHVKKVLDQALLDAGVEYLYSCYATDVLVDAKGQPVGIVMANRAGRQAVKAKQIIDATDRAVIARLAGAPFRAYPAGMQTFQRTVICPQVVEGEGLSSRLPAAPYIGPYPNKAKTSSGEFHLIEYTMKLPMNDSSHASSAAADQMARTKTYHPEQQFTADRLFQVPPDPMYAVAGSDAKEFDPAAVSLDVCRPKGVENLFVLGGCADLSREAAAKLLRPLSLIDLGTRIGRAAAEAAAKRPVAGEVRVAALSPAPEDSALEVREFLTGVRPTQKLPGVSQPARGLPVFGRYDVVVVGGGTGGAPAGISAARQGVKTLVIEYLHGLGGVGTLGAISTYYWGNRVGFTATVPGSSWVVEQRMQWWRSEILDAGGDLWFGTMGCGAVVEGNKVVGVVVATPVGRGVVLAKTVIDATGNSDVAAAAGAETYYTDETEFGMQGTGLPGRRLGQTYNNTDFTIVDETDMVDVWQMFVFSKHKYPDAFDHGQLIDTRERRRIVGDTTIRLVDQILGRTYPDSVVQARSNFDTHGYTVDPLLLVEHPEHKGFNVYIPYRAMLPKGWEGVLIVGLGTSAHRDAVPLIRMQPDIQNQGYAAGVAAAMAVRSNRPLRGIDIKELQRHLVEVGNLPESVLTDQDSFPLPTEKVAEAVRTLPEGQGAAVIMAQPQDALPLLRDAYRTAKDAARLEYARILAVLGDASGVETLVDEIRRQEKWDKGWNYRGMGQFGAALSPLDGLIIAAARTGRRDVLPAIQEKMALLDASVEFSHHRAIALACEMIGDPAASPVLAEVLKKPGMMGHHHDSVAKAIKRGAPGGTNAEQTRRESLRELMLARALFRCGDHEGLGRAILENYTRDLRGHLARHAQAVLDTGTKPGAAVPR